ncbi:MAG: DoxX family protein [Bdellovibrionales bacterium]|nr:DoxX family protein [Bdellovibrionales bacterium]
MTEPVGDALYAPFFLRLALGSYFVLAGLAKLDDPGAFVAQVQGFEILPVQFATVYGILLPYVEIVSGGMLLCGMWTTLASIVTSLLLVSFIYAFGFFPPKSHLFNKDVILLAISLSIMFSGSGAFSVDRFRKQG